MREITDEIVTRADKGVITPEGTPFTKWLPLNTRSIDFTPGIKTRITMMITA
jgi:hypothetical protein